MTSRGLKQTDVADLLGGTAKGWTQSRISKLLNGHAQLGLEELEALCFAVGLSVVEAVRDQGMEFLAEMTPTELRTLQRIKLLDEETRDAFLRILDVKLRGVVTTRYAGKEPVRGPRFGKPRAPK